MVQILTPSTGAVREGGKLRLNILGYEVGERVLFWVAGAGWAVSEIAALADTTVGVLGYGAVPYRNVGGVVPLAIDADDLLARLRAVQQDSAGLPHAERWEATMAFLEAGEFTRVPPFVPGM